MMKFSQSQSWLEAPASMNRFLNVKAPVCRCFQPGEGSGPLHHSNFAKVFSCSTVSYRGGLHLGVLVVRQQGVGVGVGAGQRQLGHPGRGHRLHRARPAHTASYIRTYIASQTKTCSILSHLRLPELLAVPLDCCLEWTHMSWSSCLRPAAVSSSSCCLRPAAAVSWSSCCLLPTARPYLTPSWCTTCWCLLLDLDRA